MMNLRFCLCYDIFTSNYWIFLITNNWAFTYHEHQYLTIHLTSYDNAECKVSEVSHGFRRVVLYITYYIIC